jgi:hypothetical protein
MYKRVLILVLSIVIVSCDSDIDTGTFVVGSDYLEINNNVILVDTMTVDVSTIQLDSLVTSSKYRITVGSYDDPVFGKVQANSYFQLSGSSYTINASSSDTEGGNYVFDSIRMVMKLDKYYYGDTTQVHSFSIHRLQQKVKTSLEDNTFHNDSSLSYDSESLGTISFKPKPNSQDSVSVVLSNDFGNALFQKLKSKDITNSDEFIEYFKGFVIKTSTSNSSNVIGFDLSSELRLYYSKYLSQSENSLVVSFGIYDGAKQFNNFSLDKTGTLIENLPNSKSKLSSVNTSNKGFIQSGTGIACRVDFPNIKQLKRLYDNGAIIEAQFTIKPVTGTYSSKYPLADSLEVYVCDNLNRIKRRLTSSTGSSVYAVLNNTSDEFNEEKGYKLSLTTFLQSELVKLSDAKSSLIFVLPSLSKGVNRLVLADQKSKENKLQLKIYYISY